MVHSLPGFASRHSDGISESKTRKFHASVPSDGDEPAGNSVSSGTGSLPRNVSGLFAQLWHLASRVPPGFVEAKVFLGQVSEFFCSQETFMTTGPL